jgi:hypothetical protein
MIFDHTAHPVGIDVAGDTGHPVGLHRIYEQ